VSLVPPGGTARVKPGAKGVASNYGLSPPTEALFPIGQIVATPGALNPLTRSNQTPDEFLSRHAAGD
jgi:hypothetical protein